MSEYEQDPSASTGKFRAFVERGDEDPSKSRSMPVSPGVLIAIGVVVVAIVIIAIAL